MELLELETVFDDFLLFKINVVLNEKVIKTGKLKHVLVKNNNIKLLLEQENGTIKNFEAYYPFNITKNADLIIFDYSIGQLNHGKNKVTHLIEPIITERSRFFDNKLIFNKL